MDVVETVDMDVVEEGGMVEIWVVSSSVKQPHKDNGTRARMYIPNSSVEVLVTISEVVSSRYPAKKC